MTRTSRLLVVATCVFAFVVPAWFALRAALVTDEPYEVGTTAAPPSVETERVPSSSRGAVAKAPADDARRKPANPPARWIVHVVAAEDGTPISNAQLEVSGDPDWPRRAAIDANGDVRVEASVLELEPAVVKLRLRVAAPGRVRETVRTDVASGKEQEETVRLHRAFAVDGLVHDAAGRPIADAHVSARLRDGDEFTRTELAAAVSAADGRFTVEGLPIGALICYEVGAPRHVTRWISRRAHDAAPLDVRLDPAGSVRGVIRSPTGAPVSGAHATAHRIETDEIPPSAEERSAPTGIDGRFEIDCLPLGDVWTLVAGHDDFMVSEESPPIRLSAETTEASCDLSLRPAGHLEVELAFAGEHDPCVAELRWEDGEESTKCSVPGRTTRVVREPGTLAFDVCADGLRAVSAEAEVGSGDARTLKIALDEGESLSGIVVDDEGAPVGGALVTVDPDKPAEQHALSASDGTFAVKGVVFQVHEVCTTADGHGASDRTHMSESVTWMRIEVPRNGEAALRLRVPDGAARPSRLRIRWLGPAPVDDDVARWSDGEVSCSLPPGYWHAEVEASGYVTWRRPTQAFFIVAGDRTDLGEVVLDPGLPLAGRVVDVDGRGVPNLEVLIDSDPVETDSAGGFNAAHVAAGYHDIRTQPSPDFLGTLTRVRLDKDTEPVVLTVRRGAVLRVALHSVRRVMGFAMNVEALPGDLPDDVVHAPGAALFMETPDSYSARLPAGARRIVVRCSDTTLATKEVVLRDGEDVSVQIDLEK
jgi:hypothetical protein